MRFSRKVTALSIALVVCGTGACTDLEGTWVAAVVHRLPAKRRARRDEG